MKALLCFYSLLIAIMCYCGPDMPPLLLPSHDGLLCICYPLTGP
jgi:hypothetical protein